MGERLFWEDTFDPGQYIWCPCDIKSNLKLAKLVITWDVN